MYSHKIIVALDNLSTAQCMEAIADLKSEVYGFKVGYEAISRGDVNTILGYANNNNVNIFYDGKFHDIPKTIELSCTSLLKFPAISMITLHTLGGKEMLQSAVRAKKSLNRKSKPLMLGVTLLTSTGDEHFREMGLKDIDLEEAVLRLSLLAKDAGLDGVIASAKEAKIIKKVCGNDFIVVTPGIKTPWINSNDQKRTVTPKEALSMGADYIVIGRSIFNNSHTPIEALKRIVTDLENS